MGEMTSVPYQLLNQNEIALASYQSHSVLNEANEAYHNYLGLEPIKSSKLEELENQLKAKYYAERLQHYTKLSILYRNPT